MQLLHIDYGIIKKSLDHLISVLEVPNSTSAFEAVGVALITLYPWDPVTRQFAFLALPSRLATHLQVMHPVRAFPKPDLSFPVRFMSVCVLRGDRFSPRRNYRNPLLPKTPPNIDREYID